ncbi:MAG: sec-independent protein translocase protein TatA [Actinomycetota bacterium]|jgi:TatA/E family protein of Tat protein translocase|nr:sec-independent protein translocase protein TatA [Actinomycetota bacterium]
MSFPGGGEMLIILLVLLLLFGATRLPKLARSMGQAGKEFKTGLKEGYQAQPVEGPCPFCATEIPADSKFCPGCAKSAAEIVAEKEKKAQAS